MSRSHALSEMANADTSDKREVFLPDHRWLDDAVLLALPARGPLTRLALFVCTYVAKLGNLHIDFVELTRIMCKDPHGCLLALNSNFGHAAQPGFEGFLKAPKPPPERRVPARGRARKVQGDGTCFNSAVEPVVAIDHPGIPDDKVYFVKCFPTTGETQVPGVISPDLSDGHAVLEAFVAYLNELDVGDLDEDPRGRDPVPADFDARAGPPPRRPIVIISEQPKMLNYKFRVIRNSPRILVNLHHLASYLHNLEMTKAVEGVDLPELQLARFAGWPALLLPPFTVRETKPPTDDVKVSFRFEGEDRAPRINVFQEGKINILGADTVEAAEKIYDYFVRLFTANWSMLVCLQPRRDLERRQVRPPPRQPPVPQPPPVRLTDTEVDSILADVLGGDFTAAAATTAPAPESNATAAAPTPADEAQNGEESLVPDSIVNDIVGDLADWGFDEDEAETSSSEEAPADEWEERRAARDMARQALLLRRAHDVQPALQDPVLDEIDRENVEDDEEDSL